MRKSKLLTPILTIGTLGAIVTPMTVLTSCGNKNTGANANLVKDYVCEVKALDADKAKFGSESEALTAYLNAVNPKTNGGDYTILKDDARYAYSIGLKSDNFKEHVHASFDSYTLDFENVDIDNDTKTMSVKFVINITNGSHGSDDASIKVRNANLKCEFEMDTPFTLTFHKADDKTIESKNYIACELGGVSATYWLSGKCTINGDEQEIPYAERKCDDITMAVPEPTDPAEKICAYMAKEFVLTGLTCNYEDFGASEMGGALFSNYMSNAKIGA